MNIRRVLIGGSGGTGRDNANNARARAKMAQHQRELNKKTGRSGVAHTGNEKA